MKRLSIKILAHKSIRKILAPSKPLLQRLLTPLLTPFTANTFYSLPHDTYIASFPKSGNTWITFMVANLLTGNRVNSSVSMQETVPGVNSISARLAAQRKSTFRVFTTHMPFDPSMRKVIYLVRDPRSVAVSNYFYAKRLRRIDDKTPFSDFFQEFITPKVTQPFGCWYENTGSWIGSRYNTSNFLLLRYEDVLKDTAKAVSLIANFLNINCSNLKLEETVKLGSFENMRKMTDKEPLPKNKQHYRKDIKFIQKADPKEWINFFSENDIEKLFKYCGGLMHRLNYTK